MLINILFCTWKYCYVLFVSSLSIPISIYLFVTDLKNVHLMHVLLQVYYQTNISEVANCIRHIIVNEWRIFLKDIWCNTSIEMKDYLHYFIANKNIFQRACHLDRYRVASYIIAFFIRAVLHVSSLINPLRCGR